MKRSNLILASVLAIIFTSVLIIFSPNSQKISPPSTPTPIYVESVSSSLDPTADWKTYTDETWNYSVKYPADWKVVSFQKPTIDIMPATNDDRNLGSISLSLTMNQEIPVVPPSFTDFSNVDPPTCGNSTWAVKNNANDSFVCWKYNRDVYFIPKYSSVVTKDIYFQIISTFKFTESTSPTITPALINDLTTYSSNLYGFSFKYPYQSKIYGDLNSQVFSLNLNSKVVSVLISSNLENLSPSDFFLKQIAPQNPDSIKDYVDFSSTIFNGNTFTIATQNPEYFKQQSGSLKHYLISSKNYIIDFSYSDSTTEINQILSTFKFIP